MSWSCERPVHPLRERLHVVRDADHHRAGESARRRRRVQRPSSSRSVRSTTSSAPAAGPFIGSNYSVALFLGRIKDAIVQQQEVGGRAFFVTRGRPTTTAPRSGSRHADRRTHSEWRLHLRPLSLRRLQDRLGTEVDTLDGNRLPGVPEHYWRLGLRTALPRGLYLDADHTISSSVAADDANTIVVDAWGAGMTNSGRLVGDAGSVNIAPFLGVNNLWDRQYIGSVTLNGVGGRVIEPAPRRVITSARRSATAPSPAQRSETGSRSIATRTPSPRGSRRAA